ncbi:hypothetical protein D4R30_00395 [archaeon]|nr:MAG: hypothetical protein D4R30_00395 [archaeon]
MAEPLSDWKVWITLDRELLTKDITMLVRILARQREFCLISASSQDDALVKARALLASSLKTPLCYVKAMTPRRAPT